MTTLLTSEGTIFIAGFPLRLDIPLLLVKGGAILILPFLSTVINSEGTFITTVFHNNLPDIYIYIMLSEIFYNSLMITVSGLALALIGVCYKSKCRTIRCCGLEIERDVEGEEKIDEIEAADHRVN